VGGVDDPPFISTSLSRSTVAGLAGDVMRFSLSRGVLDGCGLSKVTFFFFLGALFGLGAVRTGVARPPLAATFPPRPLGDGFDRCGGDDFDVDVLLVTLLAVAFGPRTFVVVDDLAVDEAIDDFLV